jgi:hypothetical protein
VGESDPVPLVLSRQPCALGSEVRAERPRSVHVRDGEESSYDTQVLGKHNTTVHTCWFPEDDAR